MKQRTGKDERIAVSSLNPPETTAICTKLEKPGLIPRASSFPPCTYPKVVERAYRLSTRVVVKIILDTLQGCPNQTGAINVSSLARATKYHRKTVDRALAFGIRFKILERVDWKPVMSALKLRQPGRPVRYKSLWKCSCSPPAPPLKKSYKVQALASTKTGLCPSPKLRKAAMVRLRISLRDTGQPRLTSAYGKYVWSKAATVAGITLLVRTASAMINDRTKTLPIRDAFAVVVQNINLACRSLDATERYLATLKREALPDDIDDLFKKPALANMDNFVYTPHHTTHHTTKTLPLPQLEFKGALPSTNDDISISTPLMRGDTSSTPDGQDRITNPAIDEGGTSSPLISDRLLQRWRTLIQRLTTDDARLDAQPRMTSDDDITRPRAGPQARHGGAVPRPFGPRRAAIADGELARRRRQARRSVRMTERSDARRPHAVHRPQRRDARTLTSDADH